MEEAVDGNQVRVVQIAQDSCLNYRSHFAQGGLLRSRQRQRHCIAQHQISAFEHSAEEGCGANRIAVADGTRHLTGIEATRLEKRTIVCDMNVSLNESI